MGCFQKRAAMVIVFGFLLACEAGVVSGDPPSPSAVDHEKTVVHMRKLLNITAAGTAATEEELMMGLEECSEQAVVLSQDSEGPMPNGIASYSVAITNTCLSRTVREVHVSCGEFASTELVNPNDFRRVAVGDCLVRNGGAMGPGETVAFEYSNLFKYQLDVVSVSCS
ncbi:TPD1 protein homolog 1B-like [Phragmites australis]|uniref:TPD1 protein homolog 1B-like n=1 Tax=Phragmites australis TaxID=29695 RepID=UPI002D7903EC|nr:TPD1 protein homolog 1B-like [Phragmites australis]